MLSIHVGQRSFGSVTKFGVCVWGRGRGGGGGKVREGGARAGTSHVFFYVVKQLVVTVNITDCAYRAANGFFLSYSVFAPVGSTVNKQLYSVSQPRLL